MRAAILVILRGDFYMNGQEAYLQAIRNSYPELHINSAGFHDHGQNSDVVVVDSEVVFRFPKYDHVLERLKIEAAILKGIQGYVTLPVPNPLWAALNRPVGEAFVGYRMVLGEPLWRDTFRAIENQAVVEGIAHQVASFLQALHTVPVDEAIGIALPRQDTHAEVADIYHRIRLKLFDRMRPDAQAWAAAHWEDFLGDPANWQYGPVLKHGDFGPSNILFDQQSQQVTGIIDFGSSGLGDPAYDFAGLLSGYGEEFIGYCAEVYPAVKGFLGRIRFYRGTFALLEALFGIENGDDGALAAGLRQYI
jgi:aminoglycoside 2''-phosphotransferase